MNYLVESLKKESQKNPNSIFLENDKKSWTFKSFYEEVAKLSTFLLNKGIKKGDFVLIHLEEKSEHLISYMALLNIGAISVHLYSEREDEYIIFATNHTNAKAIISSKFKQKLDNVLIFDFPKENNLPPTYEITYHEIAYVMFTSGTTSSPKAVLTTHENIEFVSKTLINLANMRENLEREIIILPLGSTGGLGHFHANLVLGNYIKLFDGFYNLIDLDKLLDDIKSLNITGILLTPNIITKLLHFHKPKLKTHAKNLKYSLANVTPMKKETIKDFLDTLPNIRFCTYYGSTEASRSVLNVCRESREFMHLTGKEADGLEVEIRNKNQNGEGEIYIRGKNVMKGYLNRKDSLKDGWFQTGDMGRKDENGYITVLGRIKDTISLDGLKIFPMEIENIALNNRNIAEAGVCEVEENFETAIGFAVVIKNQNIDKKELTKELYNDFFKAFKMDKTYLYSYKLPKKIYFLSEIPRMGLGKTDREKLKKMIKECKDIIILKGENDK